MEIKPEEKQPLVVAIIIPFDNGKVLMHQRKKQPFYDYWGFPGGKVKFGETIAESASRELFEETGLKGIIELKGLVEMKSYDKGILVHHHYHHIFSCNNVTGVLLDTDEGPNAWMDNSEIKKIESILYPDVPLLLEIAKGKYLRLIELKRLLENGKFVGMEIMKDVKATFAK